ncbi:F1F0 ATP synthase subunit i KNAG_0M00340 [Huiozyma naganishii CBS 8797]|uniref:ATP synthase subunit J, mitochondrial n=1 Tax=Huiozyma naganishii (strain ATCC MYA-139 / BCRC 22969 / CBS 8797 / KCTC 17520 / NBRC 10181 / NCYC 3082 / Yp74L-3) TaxID=1071383 RepID=J7S3X9_HUIN7|nr:hypothetical protein KNAG_0M00340 [Kazachstania naganishii CBS 8797]CCK72887.1 hypothetical protein KNAG_0M00340 [Kazachstania naganishii CBS 8797]
MIKKFPTPVLKPYWPFFAGGLIVYYGMSKFTNVMLNSDEFVNDPRNPRFARGEKPVEKH